MRLLSSFGTGNKWRRMFFTCTPIESSYEEEEERQCTYSLAKGSGKVFKDEVRKGLRHGAEAVLDVVAQHTSLNAEIGRGTVGQMRDD